MSEWWETEIEFDNSMKKLIQVLPLPDCFSVGNYGTYFSDGRLYLQSVFGSYKNIHAVIHELSHFLLHDYEYAFINNWGLRNPNLYISGISIDPGSSKKETPIDAEIKVWAIQFVIECMCGFRNFTDDVPDHEEVVYVNDMKYLNRYHDIRPYLLENLQREVNKLLKTDFKKEFIDKINEFPNIIKNRNYDICYENEKSIRKHDIKWSRNVFYRIEITENNGWYSVSVKQYNDNELSISEEACITRSKERAEKIFLHCVNINTD